MRFPDFKEYREPFVGGGAVFFHLCPCQGWVNDTDPNIINTYSVIQERSLCKDLAQRIIRAKYPTREEHRNRGVRLTELRDQGFTEPDIDAAFDFLLAIKFCSRARIYGGTIGFDHWVGKKQDRKSVV